MRPELVQLGLPLPIAIIGLGISGQATQSLLIEAGLPENEILIFDENQTSGSINLQEFINLKRPKSICVSPGVPLAKAEIKAFATAGGRITSELEIATSFLTTEKVIAITGSIGKSTVTSLIGEAGKYADQEIFVGGNLGTPLAQYALEKIKGHRNQTQYVVLELSSYQLENYKNLNAECGILTYLSPNHMERYTSLEHYYDTKLSLFNHVKKYIVCNTNGGDIVEYLKSKVIPASLSRFFIDRNSQEIHKHFLFQPALLGKHNLDNIALAFKVCDLFKWPQESYNALLKFNGLPHRLENCGEKSEILFINDSKATAMDPVQQAFLSIREQFPDRHIHLLLGGKDKDLPWQNLSSLNNQKNLTVYFFGAVGATAKMKTNIQGDVYKTLASCLEDLTVKIKKGDIVLFSPGGTSWDEFKNFEQRGEFFKSWLNSKF